MLLIHGKDVIGLIDDVPIFCGTDCTFSEAKEVIPASTVTSGGWKEFRLRKRSWTFEVGGLTKIDSTDGQVSYFDLITSTEAVMLDNVSVSFMDGDGNTVTIEGSMYKHETSISGPADQSAKSSVRFIGFGAYSLTTGPCVAVGTSGSFEPPDGAVGIAYSYTFSLTGTNPKTLGAFFGNPSWMEISVASGDLVLGGTPTSSGTFFLDITINNDCGSINVIDEFGATIV